MNLHNFVSFVSSVIIAATLMGCGSPSDGNAQAAASGTAGTSGISGSAGNSGSSGSAGNSAAGNSGSIPSGSAGMANQDPCLVLDCSNTGGVCVIGANGKASCEVDDPCGVVDCQGKECIIEGNKAKCVDPNAGGAAGSSSGASGSSGSAGNSGSAGSSSGASGSAGGSSSICASAQEGAWCPLDQAGIICGNLMCNGVWGPVNSGSAGSSGASGSSGSAGNSGSTGSSGDLLNGEVGEFSLTIAFKETGSHSLSLYAFENSGSFAWGTDPNVSATDTRITWKTAAHWGSYVEFNGMVDGSFQLCDAMKATEPMWATFKRSNGTVLPIKIANAVSAGGGCHLQYHLQFCATNDDPDCDGKTLAQGDCDQTIGKGTASYPGALESANDTDDLNCDNVYNPGADDVGQVYVQMTGVPHGVNARLYDDQSWVEGGIVMTEVENGVYKTANLATKPKSFYVTWTPTVNGKSSSAGLQGGICVANVSTVNVYNTGTNTVATSATITLDQNCHWSATY